MDLKLALRRLRAAPLFTIFSIVTLACGIGVTTAAYSAIYALGARPLGLEAPERLAWLSRSNAINRAAPTPVSLDELGTLSTRNLGLSSVAAWSGFDGVLAGPAISERVSAERVSGSYFATVGVPMARGRGLTAGDDVAAAAPVIVLSDHAWRKHFDGDPAALGAEIRLGGVAYQIVGIARRDFRGLSTPLVGGISGWVTLAAAPPPARVIAAGRADRPLNVVARLAPGATLAMGTEAVAALAREVDAASPLPSPANQPQPGRYWALTSIEEATDFASAESARIVMILPLIVLLVACTNLANLVLSRSASRRHEYAVRGALGASRWHLLRDALTESALVVGIGTLLGVGLAHGLLLALVSILREPIQAVTPSFPLDWQLDPILFSGAAAGAVISMLVAGLFPALQMTRVDFRRNLTTGDAVQSLPRWRGRSNLIALQIGVSATLFLITTMMTRYIVLEPPPWLNRDPGLAQFSVGETRLDVAAPTTADAIVAELMRQPGVAAAAIATDLPFTSFRFGRVPVDVWRAEDAPPVRGPGTGLGLIGATPSLFAALNLRIVAGRTFAEGGEATPAVIVDEDFAQTGFGQSDPIGRALLLRARWGVDRTVSTRSATIVGVVAAASSRRQDGARGDAFVYVPLPDGPVAARAIVVARPHSPDAPMTAQMQGALRAVDRDLAFGAIGRGNVMAVRGWSIMQVFAGTLGSLASLTIILAGAGLYGALTDIVTRRTREMGIRLALGAGAPRIVAMVLRQGVRPIAEGMFIGFGAALVIRQLMQNTLTAPISAIDVGIAVTASLPLVIAGLLATYLPARRAARVNPNVALRTL